MECYPPADNALPHFLTMMVRAPRAVDLLRKYGLNVTRQPQTKRPISSP